MGGVALSWTVHGDVDALRIELPAEVTQDGDVRVYPVLADDAPALLQPMAGTLAADGTDVLVFVPRYPFVAGAEYRVEVRRGPSASIVRPARPLDPTTTVVAIHPSLATVPRNLLRFYVEFSAPMSEGEVARCVSLVDAATGAPLRDAILSFEPELWDPSRRRLTVFLDPARIKRGLVPHADAGYPLIEGRAFEIVVDAGFRDAQGQPLVRSHRVRCAVGPDLRGRVDPGRWTVGRPLRRGPPDPLHLEFDRPLDVGLLAHGVRVVGVDGTGAPAGDGRSWTFVPAEPWSATGTPTVRVDPILEDVAGNSVSRVFDRDLADPGDDPVPREAVELEISLD